MSANLIEKDSSRCVNLNIFKNLFAKIQNHRDSTVFVFGVLPTFSPSSFLLYFIFLILSENFSAKDFALSNVTEQQQGQSSRRREKLGSIHA